MDDIKQFLIKRFNEQSYLKSFLNDVEEGRQFIFENGKEARNLMEFLSILKKSDQFLINKHITNRRNDFYNWIKDVIGDEELAESIKNIKIKADLVYLIGKRIEWYKEIDKKLKEEKESKIEIEIEKIKEEEEKIKEKENEILRREKKLINLERAVKEQIGELKKVKTTDKKKTIYGVIIGALAVVVLVLIVMLFL